MNEVKIFRIYSTPDEMLCTCIIDGDEDEALQMVREHEWLGPQLGDGCRAVESEEL